VCPGRTIRWGAAIVLASTLIAAASCESLPPGLPPELAWIYHVPAVYLIGTLALLVALLWQPLRHSQGAGLFALTIVSLPWILFLSLMMYIINLLMRVDLRAIPAFLLETSQDILLWHVVLKSFICFTVVVGVAETFVAAVSLASLLRLDARFPRRMVFFAGVVLLFGAFSAQSFWGAVASGDPGRLLPSEALELFVGVLVWGLIGALGLMLALERFVLHRRRLAGVWLGVWGGWFAINLALNWEAELKEAVFSLSANVSLQGLMLLGFLLLIVNSDRKRKPRRTRPRRARRRRPGTGAEG